MTFLDPDHMAAAEREAQRLGDRRLASDLLRGLRLVEDGDAAGPDEQADDDEHDPERDRAAEQVDDARDDEGEGDKGQQRHHGEMSTPERFVLDLDSNPHPKMRERAVSYYRGGLAGNRDAAAAWFIYRQAMADATGRPEEEIEAWVARHA